MENLFFPVPVAFIMNKTLFFLASILRKKKPRNIFFMYNLWKDNTTNKT